MSLTSKSPQDVAREALAAGTAALTLYSHKFSPKTFTQPQLLACLVLKKPLKTDYRGIAVMLADHSDLRAVLGLEQVPHATTLQESFGADAAGTIGLSQASECDPLSGHAAKESDPAGRRRLFGAGVRPCQPLLREAASKGTEKVGA